MHRVLIAAAGSGRVILSLITVFIRIRKKKDHRVSESCELHTLVMGNECYLQWTDLSVSMLEKDHSGASVFAYLCVIHSRHFILPIPLFFILDELYFIKKKSK